MIKLFDVENKILIPTEHCYSLYFLKAIMDEYPDDHIAIYKYLFYMTCPNPDLNPFFHFPEEEKEEIILQEIEAEFSVEDPLVVKALDLCYRMYETETSRAYKGIKIMLDNMSKVLASETPTFGRDGSATALLNIAVKFDAVRQSFKGVFKDLQEEQESKVRGSQKLAYDS